MEKYRNKATHAGRKKGLAAMLVLLLTLLAVGAGMPAKAADVKTTTAKVSFKEGDLVMEPDPSGSMLNFDFGEHYLPITEVSYPAENKEAHILEVEDGRVKSGSWNVTVALTSFTDIDGNLDVLPFEAMINLKAPTAKNDNEAVGTAGLTVNEDIKVISNKGEQLVMKADATLKRGIYSLEWTNENVNLNISDAEVARLDLETYTALVSWTLNVGPQ